MQKSKSFLNNDIILLVVTKCLLTNIIHLYEYRPSRKKELIRQISKSIKLDKI